MKFIHRGAHILSTVGLGQTFELAGGKFDIGQCELIPRLWVISGAYLKLASETRVNVADFGACMLGTLQGVGIACAGALLQLICVLLDHDALTGKGDAVCLVIKKFKRHGVLRWLTRVLRAR